MPDTEPTPETATETCTYTNPVYKGYFADPFVWEYQGVYYAIGTGVSKEAEQVDEIADAVRVDRSTDELRIFPLALPRLLTWHFAGNAAAARPRPRR